MDYIFEDWQKQLAHYADSVEKNLEEIRKCKADIQRLQMESFNRQVKGNFVRDDERIILSAPEIIIGNVDSCGTLYEGTGSRVIIRGTQVGMQGAGDGGRIEVRASSIRQIAEDPGCDGYEHVVTGVSEVVSQARNIIIQSNNADKAFSAPSLPAGGSGVVIRSDNVVEVGAAVTAESREKRLSDLLDSLKTNKKSLKEQADGHKKAFENLCKAMGDLLDKKDKLITDDDSVRTNYNDIEDLGGEIEGLAKMMSEEVRNYSAILAMLSETNRQIKCFEEEKKAIVKGDDYKKQITGATVSIAAENINMAAVDGEGNVRQDENTGVNITTCHFSLSAVDEQGKLMDEGDVNINAKTVKVGGISTTGEEYDEQVLKQAQYATVGDVIVRAKNVTVEGVDYEVSDKKLKEKALVKESKIKLRAKNVEVSTEASANVEVDDKNVLTKASYTAEGDVIIKSKNVTVEGVDYDYEDKKLKEKSLTEGGKISIRAEKMDLSATDTEGKATGSININAKAVGVKSMDVDKEKRTDNKLAAGSTMLLVAEKMYVGAKSNDVKSKKLQAASEEIALIADKTLEAQQDKKAILQLSGGNTSVGGSKTQVYGETTINAKMEVKGDFNAPEGTFDNLEAKTSFKSANISDGIAIPKPGATGSLSAKMSLEDAPKE